MSSSLTLSASSLGFMLCLLLLRAGAVRSWLLPSPWQPIVVRSSGRLAKILYSSSSPSLPSSSGSGASASASSLEDHGSAVHFGSGMLGGPASQLLLKSVEQALLEDILPTVLTLTPDSKCHSSTTCMDQEDAVGTVTMVLGVSGGCDSMALLHALHHYCMVLPASPTNRGWKQLTAADCSYWKTAVAVEISWATAVENAVQLHAVHF